MKKNSQLLELDRKGKLPVGMVENWKETHGYCPIEQARGAEETRRLVCWSFYTAIALTPLLFALIISFFTPILSWHGIGMILVFAATSGWIGFAFGGRVVESEESPFGKLIDELASRFGISLEELASMGGEARCEKVRALLRIKAVEMVIAECLHGQDCFEAKNLNRELEEDILFYQHADLLWQGDIKKAVESWRWAGINMAQRACFDQMENPHPDGAKEGITVRVNLPPKAAPRIKVLS